MGDKGAAGGAGSGGGAWHAFGVLGIATGSRTGRDQSKEVEMAQALPTHSRGAETGEQSPEQQTCSRREVERERPIDRFLSELGRMSAEERIRGSRYSFNARERSVYAARFPEEVPRVNDELEWIALTLE